MNTEKSLYLALWKLLHEVASNEHHNKNLGVVNSAAYEEAQKAMAQFELELGPLPHWASAHHITGEPVMYAQLYTRNPRAHGNGLIYHIGDSGDTFGIITDIGNTMIVNRKEMDQYFEIGDFIMNEDAYMKRYRQRDDYVEPPVRGL